MSESTKAGHTAGRLAISEYGQLCPEGTEEPIYCTGGVTSGSRDSRSIANRDRLAACWNACEGISTAELADGQIDSAVWRERNELRAKLDRWLARNESLAAERDTLRSEVERLRAALQAIEAQCVSEYARLSRAGDATSGIDGIVAQARAALGGRK